MRASYQHQQSLTIDRLLRNYSDNSPNFKSVGNAVTTKVTEPGATVRKVTVMVATVKVTILEWYCCLLVVEIVQNIQSV